MSELGRPHTEEAAYCSFLRVSRSQCQFRLSIVIDVTKESLCFELMCVCVGVGVAPNLTSVHVCGLARIAVLVLLSSSLCWLCYSLGSSVHLPSTFKSPSLFFALAQGREE